MQRQFSNVCLRTKADISIKHIGYNFSTEQFKGVTNGQPLDQAYFTDAADTARRIGAQTVGRTTNERAAFLDSLLREEGRCILAHLSSQSNVG